MLFIKPLKSAVLRLLKLQHKLDLSGNNAGHTGIVCQLRGDLPAGWYMIEAEPDVAGIGSILDIRTFTDSQHLHQSGSQSLQLANARTAKRIIQVKRKSCAITISSNTRRDTSGLNDVTLIRLTPSFAQNRLASALGYFEHAQRGSLNKLPDIQALYEQYTGLCPSPEVECVYEGFKKPALKPLASLITASEYAEYFSIVYLDKNSAAMPTERYAAPFVILTTREIQATSQLHDVLSQIVGESENNSGIQFWYTDHDHFTVDGTRIHPQLKPCYNKGLLRHGNYVGPLIICTKALFNQFASCIGTLDDSAILFILLKLSDHVQDQSIRRIAAISYSVPASRYCAPHGHYIGENDKHAIDLYLEQKSDNTLTVSTGVFPDTWQIMPMPVTPEPSVEIIIATRDKVELLAQCVSSIFNYTRYPNYTITVVDNDSIEVDTHEYHRRMSDDSRYRKIEYSGEFNFSAINNKAAQQSTADVLVLLNNDTEIRHPDWLDKMVNEISDSEIGCVGARLVYPNGLLQHAGVVTGLQGVAGHIHRFAASDDEGYAARIHLSSDVSAVTGACLGIRRTVFAELGGLDARNLKVAYNDVDLCLRARHAGYRNRYLADVVLTHHESVSRGMDHDRIKRARFLAEIDYMKATYPSWIDDDPAWNPGFSRNHTTPLLTDK